MRAWGIAARLEDRRPVVIAVELDGTDAGTSATEVMRHRSEETDVARALLLLANDVDDQLRKRRPAVVVIRAMDWSPNARQAVVRTRLQVEGVLLVTARRLVERVEAMSGREIGIARGLSKEEIETMAHGLFPDCDRDAVMAALAAQALGTNRLA